MARMFKITGAQKSAAQFNVDDEKLEKLSQDYERTAGVFESATKLATTTANVINEATDREKKQLKKKLKLHEEEVLKKEEVENQMQAKADAEAILDGEELLVAGPKYTPFSPEKSIYPGVNEAVDEVNEINQMQSQNIYEAQRDGMLTAMMVEKPETDDPAEKVALATAMFDTNEENFFNFDASREVFKAALTQSLQQDIDRMGGEAIVEYEGDFIKNMSAQLAEAGFTEMESRPLLEYTKGKASEFIANNTEDFLWEFVSTSDRERKDGLSSLASSSNLPEADRNRLLLRMTHFELINSTVEAEGVDIFTNPASYAEAVSVVSHEDLAAYATIHNTKMLEMGYRPGSLIELGGYIDMEEGMAGRVLTEVVPGVPQDVKGRIRAIAFSGKGGGVSGKSKVTSKPNMASTAFNGLPKDSELKEDLLGIMYNALRVVSNDNNLQDMEGDFNAEVLNDHFGSAENFAMIVGQLMRSPHTIFSDDQTPLDKESMADFAQNLIDIYGMRLRKSTVYNQQTQQYEQSDEYVIDFDPLRLEPEQDPQRTNEAITKAIQNNPALQSLSQGTVSIQRPRMPHGDYRVTHSVNGVATEITSNTPEYNALLGGMRDHLQTNRSNAQQRSSRSLQGVGIGVDLPPEEEMVSFLTGEIPDFKFDSLMIAPNLVFESEWWQEMMLDLPAEDQKRVEDQLGMAGQGASLLAYTYLMRKSVELANGSLRGSGLDNVIDRIARGQTGRVQETNVRQPRNQTGGTRRTRLSRTQLQTGKSMEMLKEALGDIPDLADLERQAGELAEREAGGNRRRASGLKQKHLRKLLAERVKGDKGARKRLRTTLRKQTYKNVMSVFKYHAKKKGTGLGKFLKSQITGAKAKSWVGLALEFTVHSLANSANEARHGMSTEEVKAEILNMVGLERGGNVWERGGRFIDDVLTGKPTESLEDFGEVAANAITIPVEGLLNLGGSSIDDLKVLWTGVTDSRVGLKGMFTSIGTGTVSGQDPTGFYSREQRNNLTAEEVHSQAVSEWQGQFHEEHNDKDGFNIFSRRGTSRNMDAESALALRDLTDMTAGEVVAPYEFREFLDVARDRALSLLDVEAEAIQVPESSEVQRQQLSDVLTADPTFEDLDFFDNNGIFVNRSQPLPENTVALSTDEYEFVMKHVFDAVHNPNNALGIGREQALDMIEGLRQSYGYDPKQINLLARELAESHVHTDAKSVYERIDLESPAIETYVSAFQNWAESKHGHFPEFLQNVAPENREKAHYMYWVGLGQPLVTRKTRVEGEYQTQRGFTSEVFYPLNANSLEALGMDQSEDYFYVQEMDFDSKYGTVAFPSMPKADMYEFLAWADSQNVYATTPAELQQMYRDYHHHVALGHLEDIRTVGGTIGEVVNQTQESLERAMQVSSNIRAGFQRDADMHLRYLQGREEEIRELPDRADLYQLDDPQQVWETNWQTSVREQFMDAMPNGTEWPVSYPDNPSTPIYEYDISNVETARKQIRENIDFLNGKIEYEMSPTKQLLMQKFPDGKQSQTLQSLRDALSVLRNIELQTYLAPSEYFRVGIGEAVSSMSPTSLPQRWLPYTQQMSQGNK